MITPIRDTQRKRGRPPLGDPLKSTQVRLSKLHRDKAAYIGGKGGITAGIRRALDAFMDDCQSDENDD